MRPGDRLIGVITGRLSVGNEFNNWPPHITIVPWFRTDITDEQLARELSVELKDIPKFAVRIGEEAGFGSHGRKLVNLVKLPSPLTEIERRVRAELKAHQAWLVDETTKKQRPFRPHVTVQQSGRLHGGDSLSCDRLYIVAQLGGRKRITGEVLLS